MHREQRSGGPRPRRTRNREIGEISLFVPNTWSGQNHLFSCLRTTRVIGQLEVGAVNAEVCTETSSSEDELAEDVWNPPTEIELCSCSLLLFKWKNPSALAALASGFIGLTDILTRHCRKCINCHMLARPCSGTYLRVLNSSWAAIVNKLAVVKTCSSSSRAQSSRCILFVEAAAKVD